MNALFAEERLAETSLLGSMTHAGKVGAFEGAAYEAKGLYPSRSRLHHVHARPGRLLPGVPAGDFPDHRSLLQAVSTGSAQDGDWPAIRSLPEAAVGG